MRKITPPNPFTVNPFTSPVDRKNIDEPVPLVGLEENLVLPDNLREELVKRVETEKRDLISALFDLARGAWYQSPLRDKDIAEGRIPKVYQRLPDKEALMYLLNQVIGKPKEQMKISGSSGPMKFVFEEVDEELEDL